MFDFFNQPAEHSSSESKFFVLSVGGSTIIGKTPDYELMKKIACTISDLHSEGYKFVVVVGGGKIAREYIAAGKELGASNYALDELAVKITRANAFLFIQSLEKAFPSVLTDILKAREVIDSGKIPVFGGLLPGFTTDAVAALVTESLGAKFVNLTNVDGVFDCDPNKHADAKLLKELSFKELFGIISGSDSRRPGENVVLDYFTVMVLRRSKLTALVLNAVDQENLKSAIRGESFTGSTISWGKEDEKEEREKDDSHGLEEVEYE